MNKKKLFYLLSLLFVLSHGSAWGMKKKKAWISWGNLCDYEWMKIFDYLELEDLFDIRARNKRPHAILGQYFQQSGWRPFGIKLKKVLFEIKDINVFKEKIKILKNFFGQTRRISLDCSNTTITDEQLEIIIVGLFQNNNLHGLCLRRCSAITDRVLHHFANLTSLRHLNLKGCYQITNVAFLANLTNLQSLNLEDCLQITNVEPLANLTNLQSLNLENCFQITNIKLLAQLSSLQHLDLLACRQISEGDLNLLTNNLKNLQCLNLEGCTQITCDGLRLLTNLKKLQTLKLCSCTQISNSDLQCLRYFTNLRHLDLTNCYKITAEVIQELKKINHQLTVIK